jgi:uncharacterized protein with HEPN domain
MPRKSIVRTESGGDLARVKHMRDAARECISFVKGKSRASLEKDRILALALTKELEVLGEAASRVSLEFQGAHPKIRWNLIIGMRNRLIHGYFDIDLDLVWTTVTRDLPILARHLNAAARR